MMHSYLDLKKKKKNLDCSVETIEKTETVDGRPVRKW